MSDRAILMNALRKRDILQEEIAEIEMFIRLYQKHFGEPQEEIDENIDQNLGIPQREFANIARSILASSGRPMTSRQLLGFLKEKGVPIGGADELKNLTTKLWRAREDIERLDNGAYWIRGLPIRG